MTDFLAMHHRGTPFILANVWDAGSARMLQALGAEALATSSAAHAFGLGRPDGGTITRDEALRHAEEICAATTLPVQGDFENGFGPSPEECAETTRLAAGTGLAGLCIEDTALPEQSPYPFAQAVDRIAAAAEVAQAQGLVLTARADGILCGSYGTDEAIARLTAFTEAGAQCLYAPMPASWDDLTRIAHAVPAPLNVLIAGAYAARPLADYAALGVARLSLGSSLARVSHGAILSAAQAMLRAGDFSPLQSGASGEEIDTLLSQATQT